MKRNTLKIALGCMCLWASGGAFAVDQIPGDRTITGISTYASYAVVKFSPGYTNNLGCTASVKNTAVVIDWTANANLKAMYVSALAAYTNGQTMGAGIDGCSPKYGGGTPIAYRIDVNG
jgi:hypothetical protein